MPTIILDPIENIVEDGFEKETHFKIVNEATRILLKEISIDLNGQNHNDFTVVAKSLPIPPNGQIESSNYSVGECIFDNTYSLDDGETISGQLGFRISLYSSVINTGIIKTLFTTP